MELLTNIILYLTAFFTPLILLIISYFNYLNKIRIFEILLKFILAVFGYFLSTYIIICIHILVFTNALASAENNVLDTTLRNEIIHLAFILGYVVFDAFLCWFAKGTFLETVSVFNRTKKIEIHSIYDD
jgi:hypothetical protein